MVRSIAVVVLTMTHSQTMTMMSGSLILLSITLWLEEEEPPLRSWSLTSSLLGHGGTGETWLTDNGLKPLCDYVEILLPQII